MIGTVIFFRMDLYRLTGVGVGGGVIGEVVSGLMGNSIDGRGRGDGGRSGPRWMMGIPAMEVDSSDHDCVMLKGHPA